MSRLKAVVGSQAGLALCALFAALCLSLAPAAAAATFGVKTFTMQTTHSHEVTTIVGGKAQHEFVNEPYAFTQAGGHPYALTTRIDFNTEEVEGGARIVPVQDPKDVAVELPVGMVGNPLATSRCSLLVFANGSCPGSAQVGWAKVLLQGGQNAYEDGVYNLVPPEGAPAELGLKTPVGVNFLIAAGVDNAREYRVRTFDEGVPIREVRSVEITIWGVPAEASHDPQRGRDCAVAGGSDICGEKEGGQTDTEPPTPFLTMPSDCVAPGAEAGNALLQTDSWESPEELFPLGAVKAQAAMPAVTGCEKLVFQPSIQVEPETQQADAPDGLSVNLTLQQTNTPEQLATPEVKDAVVTLPAGVSLSPSGADGLEACSDAQFDVKSSEGAKCPEKSILGTVKVKSPLLPNALEGQLFVGEPLCGNAAHPNTQCEAVRAAAGEVFRVFLQARGEGVTVKLPGTVAVNQATGQLTTTFPEDPQLPFEHLRLHVEGGPRAPLANPQSCAGMPAGPDGLPLALTSSDFTPWSTPYTPDATPESGFEVTGCAASMGFAPAFTAGTVSAKAGAFSAFTLTFSRHDDEQDLSGVQITTPPGLVGMLAKVPLCGEPQASLGTCPAGSQIGVVHAAAGAGSHPLWLEGRVYLTTGYRGAPFGLSVVVPAVAGPFNLGDVVVRSAIGVNPKTAAITITSDPLPQSRDGVPFRLQTVNVTVDRPGFMFNPTNCNAKQITGTIASVQGASVQVASRFASGDCKGLLFTPSLKALVHAGHSRKYGAYLHVVVESAFGQANIAKVHVTLPRKLPSRLSTLKQACTAAQFAENPAGCPAGSVVGVATADTPVLPVPLRGPAIFVSHGGAAFPDLDVVLQGDGVTVVLTGNTHINGKGITTSTFASVPDVPVSRFDLLLPQSAHSALAGTGNLCKKAMFMPTAITGQNGAVVKQRTKLMVSGCPKHKKPRKARTSSGRHYGLGRGK
jgi:hypothetical protein